MSDVRLQVTEEILDRVVYGMENQKKKLFLDPEDGQLKEKGADRKVLIPMPEWTPADGFRLMDGFTTTIPDASFRQTLQDILHSGSGVFRRFKDTMKERPGTEGLWHRYKQREMRKSALSWLSRWSDALELEALEIEPEEDLEDLSFSEFSFRKATGQDAPFLDMSATAMDIQSDWSNSEAWIAESPGDTVVGCAVVRPDSDGNDALILDMVYVEPEYRGLGIGRKLTELTLESCDFSQHIMIQSGPVGESTRMWLQSLGFAPVSIRWQRSRRG